MIPQGRFALLALIVLGLSVAANAADDLDTVTKKILTAWDKHKSMRAKFVAITHDKTQSGFLDYKGDGTCELLKQGDKTLVRLEYTMHTLEYPDGRKEKDDRRNTYISDGKHVYTVTIDRSWKQAFKYAEWPRLSLHQWSDVRAVLAMLRESETATILPEQTVRGRKAHVIGLASKAGEPPTLVYYFDQEEGAILRSVKKFRDGRWLSASYSDFKFDVPLSTERFTFKPPRGVNVIDRTGEPKESSSEKKP